MTNVLAIDQGTSGTKALVVDGDNNILGLSEHPVRPSYLPGGGVEQDPHELLASVVGAGRAAISKAGVPVDVVTIANACSASGHALALAQDMVELGDADAVVVA